MGLGFMKIYAVARIAALVLVATATVATAQTGQRQPGRQQPAPVQPAPPPVDPAPPQGALEPVPQPEPPPPGPAARPQRVRNTPSVSCSNWFTACRRRGGTVEGCGAQRDECISTTGCFTEEPRFGGETFCQLRRQ